MPPKPSGVERVLEVVDGFRGLWFAVFVVGIAIAAIRTGGAVGWAFAAVVLPLCGGFLVWEWRRRP